MKYDSAKGTTSSPALASQEGWGCRLPEILELELGGDKGTLISTAAEKAKGLYRYRFPLDTDRALEMAFEHWPPSENAAQQALNFTANLMGRRRCKLTLVSSEGESQQLLGIFSADEVDLATMYQELRRHLQYGFPDPDVAQIYMASTERVRISDLLYNLQEQGDRRQIGARFKTALIAYVNDRNLDCPPEICLLAADELAQILEELADAETRSRGSGGGSTAAALSTYRELIGPLLPFGFSYRLRQFLPQELDP